MNTSEHPVTVQAAQRIPGFKIPPPPDAPALYRWNDLPKAERRAIAERAYPADYPHRAYTIDLAERRCWKDFSKAEREVLDAAFARMGEQA